MTNQSSKDYPIPFLTCKDHTVSGNEFSLIFDEENQMLVTSPAPKIEELPAYYKSDAYISHTDSRSSLTDKVYQEVKKRMLQKKLKWILKKTKKKGRILDFGAGTGEFLLMAKKKGWEIEGVEPDENARALAENKGIKLEQDSSFFETEKFDVITLWHVLEHLPDLKEKIFEFQALLKKGGLLIIAVPNYKSYDASYYKHFWAAYDVPRHLWHFSRNSFQNLFKETSLKEIDWKPLVFDSFYVSILSEKYKTGKSNFFKAFYIGLKSNLKAQATSEYSSICYFFKKTGK